MTKRELKHTQYLCLCVPTGTAQCIRSGAKCPTQWKRSKPGGVKQVVWCLCLSAGPPKPEAEDQTCDEAEKWEYRPKTGDAQEQHRLLSKPHTHVLSCAQLPVLNPPFFSGCVCVFVGDIKALVPGEPAEEWSGAAKVKAPWCSSPQVWSQQSFPTQQGEQAEWNKWTS